VEAALRTELTLPNEVSVLPLARAYLRELVVLAELPAPEADAIVKAAEEACANVIDL
jgi:anti-sigma regulatory factor (Ser/Thr protein kinase)